MQDWTRAVALGGRGRVLVQFANSFPIVRIQARLGSQVIGEQVGADLRDSAGIYFSVPRVAGSYALTVAAADDHACETVTTTTRTITVQ